jgi:PII-like signaling protein
MQFTVAHSLHAQVRSGGATMLTSGKALEVSVYLRDGATHHGIPIDTSLLDFLFHNGVYGATVFKGVAGFGSSHRIHSAHILELSDELSDKLPIKIEFVETREKVESLLTELEKRSASGIIKMQETTVLIPREELAWPAILLS